MTKEKLDARHTHGPGCMEWTGAMYRDGYGAFCIGKGRTMLAHRAVYQVYKGVIPEGYHIDHLCSNKRCVNVLHLEAVTPSTNRLRGRRPNAEKTHCKHGHEFTEANTYHSSRGTRNCRRCAADRSRNKHHPGLVAERLRCVSTPASTPSS